MEIKKGQNFNLWDTNGRRADILNAIEQYLSILKEDFERHPNDRWANYPNSLKQFRFYECALDLASAVFRDHIPYDNFIKALGSDRDLFEKRDRNWIESPSNKSLLSQLNKGIEDRSRHYTSNLWRFGFADSGRNISAVGYSFLQKKIDRDLLESILPLDDTNVIILRQLSKLRVYSVSDNGHRRYYSPFFMALYLLLFYPNIDIDSFKTIVQSFSPYHLSENIDSLIDDFLLSGGNVADIPINTPSVFLGEKKIPKEKFKQHIKNRKSQQTVETEYYKFYSTLYDYIHCPSEANYKSLFEVYSFRNNRDNFKKAFGYGKKVFDFGTTNRPYSHSEFLIKNEDNRLLNKELFNSYFYERYIKSTYIDTAYEYSDTTKRMFSVSGVFKFVPSPQINYKELFEIIFDKESLKKKIIGEIADSDMEEYENNFFLSNNTISHIYGLSEEKQKEIVDSLCEKYSSDNVSELRLNLLNEKKVLFEQHINNRYPKEKALELLAMFSDRQNDKAIKEYVNEAASIPTIFEYIVAIVWYHLSDHNFDVYSSLNLSLNGDLEPSLFAPNGRGDIEIEYEDKVVLLEVTMMNASAQKKGEWEPILRHSINLKNEVSPKDAMTFFIANELDFNTINIWRAVASVPLQSSNSEEITKNVIIMPLKNSELIDLVNRGINVEDLYKSTKESYKKINTNFDINWRDNILRSVQ